MTADPHGGARLLRQGPARGAQALVLLHGRGAGAADILGLGAALAPAETRFLAPEAAGRSWWPTSFLAPMAQLEPWLASALAAVGRAVAAANAEGYEDQRIVLLGFSQGACLALEYAARAARPFKGVCALSGALVGTADADGDPAPDLHGYRPKRFAYPARLDGLPVHIGCHAQDPHIPLRRVRESAAALEQLGAACTLGIHPGAGHGVTRGDARAARALIGERAA
jgi:phospholipase/carboxylesterase